MREGDRGDFNLASMGGSVVVRGSMRTQHAGVKHKHMAAIGYGAHANVIDAASHLNAHLNAVQLALAALGAAQQPACGGGVNGVVWEGVGWGWSGAGLVGWRKVGPTCQKHPHAPCVQLYRLRQAC